MKDAPTPNDESTRIATLKALDLLDSRNKEQFDQITRLIKPLFNVPIALVSLVDSDRQWFLSKVGLEAQETPRNVSFCGHAIMGEDTFVVEDALNHKDFADNPLVTGPPNVRFYAGVPLVAKNKSKIGTLCIIDHEPRKFSEQDEEILRGLAKLVEREIYVMDLTTSDDFTGLPNFRGFVSLAVPLVRHSNNAFEQNTLAALQLKGLNQINEQRGRAVGDKLLTMFAHYLKNIQTISEVFCRVENSHFAMLIKGCTNREAVALLENFCEEVTEFLSENLTLPKQIVDLDFGTSLIEVNGQVDFAQAYSEARSQFD